MANGKSSLDAAVSTEIFRKNHPVILACNRHQAHMVPVRLAYVAGGYKPGQVIACNSVDGTYAKYDDGASSGLDTAVGILNHEAEPASGDTEAAVMIAGGKVFEAKLIGLDANGKTDLKSRTITDATGVAILSF